MIFVKLSMNIVQLDVFSLWYITWSLCRLVRWEHNWYYWTQG